MFLCSDLVGRCLIKQNKCISNVRSKMPLQIAGFLPINLSFTFFFLSFEGNSCVIVLGQVYQLESKDSKQKLASH